MDIESAQGQGTRVQIRLKDALDDDAVQERAAAEQSV